MDVSQIVLTAEGRKKLEEELAYLEGEKSLSLIHIFLAAPYVGTFVCVENALKDPATPALIAENDNVYLTRGKIVEGWVLSLIHI